MKKRRSMFMFVICCVRCGHEIIAPRKTEFLDDEVIRHLWHCPRCEARFESFPRFPANAKISERSNDERRCLSASERNEGYLAFSFDACSCVVGQI